MSPETLAISKPDQNGAKPVYEPSEDEKRIVASVKKKYRQRDGTKKAYEKTWFINHAAILGQHNLVWNEFNRAFEIPLRAPSNRTRLIVNYMMSYWRRTKARLTAHRPGLHVAPATTDEEDVEISRLSLHTLEGEFERLCFQKVLKEFVGLGLEGNAFMMPRWDPWGGPVMMEDRPVMASDPMTGTESPQVDEMGQPVTERVPVTDEFGRTLHVGEICLDIVSGFEIDKDEHATSTEDARWIMRSTIRHLDWIKEHYQEKGRYVQGEEVYANNLYLKRHRQLVGMLGAGAIEGGEREQEAKDSAVVHEYWERPSLKNPEGKLVVVAGEVLLHSGPNPYRRMLEAGIPIPICHFGEVKIPNRFWMMSMIEQAFPLNKNLNRARSMEVENRNLHGRPKVLIPKICKVREGSFDAEAGEKVSYMPGPRGEKPEFMWPQSTAAATQAEIQHSISDIQEVLSYHEVSRGILPSANIPGVAVDKLQQADDTVLGDTEGILRDAITKIGRMILCLAAEFWDEDRLVKVTGDGDAVVAKYVSGRQLSGEKQANYYDVRMIERSTMWRDPDQQRKMVEELMKMGLLDPVAHRSLILKMLDQSSVEDVFQDDRLDQQHAWQENESMQTGQPAMPRDFENHEIHLSVHNRFRKSERYRALPPELQTVLDQHCEMHEALMLQVAQKRAMMQMQAQAAGMPPEEGAPTEEPAKDPSQPDVV